MAQDLVGREGEAYCECDQEGDDLSLRRGNWETYAEPAPRAPVAYFAPPSAAVHDVTQLAAALREAGRRGGVACVTALPDALQEAVKSLAEASRGTRSSSVDEYAEIGSGGAAGEDDADETHAALQAASAERLRGALGVVSAAAAEGLVPSVLRALWAAVGAGFLPEDVSVECGLLDDAAAPQHQAQPQRQPQHPLHQHAQPGAQSALDSIPLTQERSARLRRHRRTLSGSTSEAGARSSERLAFGPATLVFFPDQSAAAKLEVWADGAWRALQLPGSGPVCVVLMGICVEWRSNARLSACRHRLATAADDVPAVFVKLRDEALLEPHVATPGERPAFTTESVGNVDERLRRPGVAADAQESLVARLYRTDGQARL
jgi:hypothetical protein